MTVNKHSVSVALIIVAGVLGYSGHHESIGMGLVCLFLLFLIECY